jgi:ankyrin repeat protein
MKSPLLALCAALLFFALAVRVSAVPPATERDFVPFPGSDLVSDDSNQPSPTMTLLTRTYATEASADEVFLFYKARLATKTEKKYVMAATLAPGEVSGVAAMTGAVYGKSFLSTASQEIRAGFAKRKKAADPDWVKGARFLWSSKDASGGTRSFSLEVMDQSVTDDDPSLYRQKTEITLKVTVSAKSAATAEDQMAGMIQLGQKSQSQMEATENTVKTTFAQDLFEPAKSGTPQQVQAALKAGGKIEDRDLGGATALMYAAGTNPDPEVISVLLKAGAGANDRDSMGMTPLMYAAAGNNAKIVSALLRAGADVHAETQPGAACLFYSAQNPNPGVVSALVKAGADVHLRFAKLAETPLLGAIRASNPVVVLELLSLGAASDLKGPDGVRALASAATDRPKPEIISALLKGGADVNGKDDDTGSTALMRAANKGVDDTHVYRLLLDSGARVNDTNQIGRTALMDAAEVCSNPEVLAVLLAAGADPGSRDAFGNTAASFARRNANLQGADLKALNAPGAVDLFDIAHNGSPDEITAALRAGSNPNTVDTTGYEMTPLMYAAQYNRDPGAVTALLKGGAKPNARDKLGRTALMLAARETDNPEVVAAFLSGGAALDIQDKMFKQTALMCAAANERTPDIVDLLLKAGANPKLTDAGKRTARDYARENPVFRGTRQLAELEQMTP